MPFTIPGASGSYLPQRAPGKTDFDILAAGYARTGVRVGCAVTAQATPNMTTAVAGGTIEVAGVVVLVTGGNVTHGAADAANPRRDLVVVNDSGVTSVVAGTASAVPVLPALPASSVALAAVDVPATVTSVIAGMITDKRVVLAAPPPIVQTIANQGVAFGAAPLIAFDRGTAWQLNDAATSGVQASVQVPPGTRGVRSARMLCSTGAASTAKNALLFLNASWAAPGEAFNAHQDTVSVTVAVPAAASTMFDTVLTAALDAAAIVPLSWLGLQLGRSGADAADTYASVVYHHALTLEWER